MTDAEKAIGVLMLEINRLHNELDLMKGKYEAIRKLSSQTEGSERGVYHSRAGVQHGQTGVEQSN